MRGDSTRLFHLSSAPYAEIVAYEVLREGNSFDGYFVKIDGSRNASAIAMVFYAGRRLAILEGDREESVSDYEHRKPNEDSLRCISSLVDRVTDEPREEHQEESDDLV